jgi:hypothetical protein
MRKERCRQLVTITRESSKRKRPRLSFVNKLKRTVFKGS